MRKISGRDVRVRRIFGRLAGVLHSVLADRRRAIFQRLARAVVVGSLACVSAAQGQVIEEGGFPVKGGGVFGESFALSCPSRLVVEPGSSIVFSCSATGVPEEGVRYGWESLSGDGLHLLSGADERAPLFTAPSAEQYAEYRYRLTAMAAGARQTASVAVSVEGVSGESVRPHGLQEACDPFTIPDELGEGCLAGKAPDPFGFGPGAEGEFLFPEAPGLTDQSSGLVRAAEFDRQAPPRLACPAAVFLEELETGAIECHAWDASGEEYLEYSWEPVGGTTRDYLDNPRLLPENSPAPSVIAPEVPAHHTLESFGSRETTFRYRYRLTATSRVTGLSSSSEVEVFVSSNRPSMYCPPEVVVEEGETVALDCEGADPLSSRMDYDEERASILWEWEGLWGTSMAPLAATRLSSPLFTAPPGSAGAEYHYIASMTFSASGEQRMARRRVTVTVVGDPEGAQVAENALAPAPDADAAPEAAITVECPGDPYTVADTGDTIVLACSADGDPGGSLYRYEWTANEEHRDDVNALGHGADRNRRDPTFTAPHHGVFLYRLHVISSTDTGDLHNVMVTVGSGIRPVQPPPSSISVACASVSPVYEGSADFRLNCRASGGSGHAYVWTPRGNTASTARLSATNISSPIFYVPGNVERDETYEYSLTVSSEGRSASTFVTVQVLNKVALSLVCSAPGEVYEGSEDFPLDCAASGGSGYAYAWTPRGATQNTDLLSATDIASPIFYVPDEVARDETYEYALIVSAARAESASAFVTVTVLNKVALSLICSAPGEVYEGSEDFELGCSALGAPGDNPDYAYVWTARGNTANTSRLSATNIPNPVFDVPSSVSGDEVYEYALTVSAANADDATAEVAVTVLNKATLSLACSDPGEVYEGSEDIELGCSALGAPGDNPDYAYVWTGRGATQNTDLLSAPDIASPIFYVPDNVERDEVYEYAITVSAAHADDATAGVTATVLNKRPLRVVCATPNPVAYEGSEDIELGCSASDAPGDSPAYAYAWTGRGGTSDAALLSATDIASPTFYVPDNVERDETYEYAFTASAANAEDATAEVTVTVLNKRPLSVVCATPNPVAYEGSEDIELDCSASGAPGDSPAYAYVWTGRGGTSDTALLSATDISSPTFYVPDNVERDETYEYAFAASAANAEDATAEVTVTVLNKRPLSVVCATPNPVAYEDSEDIELGCSASGAPGDSPAYAYVWTGRGGTSDTALLSATDISSPIFYVPDNVERDETYEYAFAASAANAEDATAEVTVTVLNKRPLRVVCAIPNPVAYEGSEDIELDCSASDAPGDSPAYAYAWTARGGTSDAALLSATDISSPIFYVPDNVERDEVYEYALTASAANAEDATAEVAVTVLNRASGVTVSVSSLRFGAQSADAEVSLDPVTDRISTYVSGPYHGGRMTLSANGSEAFDEYGEMALSIELVSPVALKRAGAVEASSLVLAPNWSYAASCDHLFSQTIGGSFTQATLSESDCRLLRFGGELDLSGVAPGRYAGNIDVILRTDTGEETHSVEAEVTVLPARQVIAIGPGGVRFSASRGVPAALTQEQSLSVYPDMAFMTREAPSGAFELSNPSLVPLEVSVSARFGYAEATEDGREIVVEDKAASRLGDLSEIVNIYPATLTLTPGERSVVRYGVREESLSSLEETGYAAFFDIVSSPRRYARADRMPEEVTGGRTARATMRAPGVYLPDEDAPRLRATLLSLSLAGPLSATFLVETLDRPFAGEVVAYDGEGRELGRRETLAYTRSRVRIPLDRMPEEEVVFLRFEPRGSGRAPEPVSVPWNAPRRDQ